MLTGCEKLWKLLIEKNMKNSLFMNKSTKPMMIQGLCFSLCFFALLLLSTSFLRTYWRKNIL